jgi:hypothetical protein
MEMSYVTIKARIAEDHSERRRLSRLPVELEARMRELGASGVEAKVLNISERGFMAVSDGRFEVGSRVWLMLPGRDRANAVIKWTAGDKIGSSRLVAAGPPIQINRCNRAPIRSLGGPKGSQLCRSLPAKPGSLMCGDTTSFTASMRSIIAPGAGTPNG